MPAVATDLSLGFVVDGAQLESTEIVSLSAAQVVVGFDRVTAPVLAVCSAVTLCVRSAEVREPVLATGVIVGRSEDDGARIYTVSIDDETRLKRALPRRLRALFDQRRDLRVEPWTDVQAVLFDEERDRRESVELVDVAPGGGGVSIGSERRLAEADRVLMTVELPEAGCVNVRVIIRNRRRIRSKILYGLEFDEAGTPDYEHQADLIRKFILAAQRRGPSD